jgi:hypothetical protein
MTKPYKHKLTKKHLKHLEEFGINNYIGIQAQMKYMVKQRKEMSFEPCFECKEIATRLGLPT